MSDDGRNAEMVNGAVSAREPQFQTVQQQQPGGYRKSSVFDFLLPSGNGMADKDRTRTIYGIKRSAIGLSEDTFDRGLWLRNERSPALYSTFG